MNYFFWTLGLLSLCAVALTFVAMGFLALVRQRRHWRREHNSAG